MWIGHQECSVGTTWSIVARCRHIHTDKLNSSDWFGHRLCMAYMQFLLTAILLSKAHPAGWILLLLYKTDILLYGWVLTDWLHNICIFLIEIWMTCLWRTCNCTVAEIFSLSTWSPVRLACSTFCLSVKFVSLCLIYHKDEVHRLPPWLSVVWR